MLDNALIYLQAKHQIGAVDLATYEKTMVLAIVAKNKMVNRGTLKTNGWMTLPRWQCMWFLKPYGYMFVSPWWEALKASVEEERENRSTQSRTFLNGTYVPIRYGYRKNTRTNNNDGCCGNVQKAKGH